MRKGPWAAAVLFVTGLSVVALRSVQAEQWTAPVHGYQLRADDDRGDGGWGRDRGGDGGGGPGWLPLWFGFHFFAPSPPPVVVEPQYYAPPPPPPPVQSYYYFCQNPEGYYPQIQSCPSGWLRVLPSAGPP